MCLKISQREREGSAVEKSLNDSSSGKRETKGCVEAEAPSKREDGLESLKRVSLVVCKESFGSKCNRAERESLKKRKNVHFRESAEGRGQ